jgi:hypothetical protein
MLSVPDSHLREKEHLYKAEMDGFRVRQQYLTVLLILG